MKDLYSDVKVSKVIIPASPSATGTIAGTAIDMQGYDSVVFVISAGLQTTAEIDVVPIVKDGTVTGTLASVTDANLIGTEAAASLDGTAGASSVSKIGYVGSKRYVTCDLSILNAASGTYAVTAVQSSARVKPVA